jgi:hypothetical protein
MGASPLHRSSPLDQRSGIANSMSKSEMDLANVIHFDSYRAYKWLLTIAGPDAKLYDYLRAQGVDLKHVINLLDGALARCEWSIAGQEEDCILLPFMDEDGVRPLDVVMFSMTNPACFDTMLRRGAVLGADEVLNPATYWDGEPCRLLRTPLEWLQEGIEGCAVILDPMRAKPTLDWAPGNLGAMDVDHANQLVAMGAVHPERVVVPLWRAA